MSDCAARHERSPGGSTSSVALDVAHVHRWSPVRAGSRMAGGFPAVLVGPAGGRPPGAHGERPAWLRGAVRPALNKGGSRSPPEPDQTPPPERRRAALPCARRQAAGAVRAPQHLGGHVAVGSSPARRVAQVVRQPGRPLVRAGPCIIRCGRAARVGSTRALSGHALVRGRGHGDARSRASGERVRSSVSSCACARPQVCNHVRAR